MRVTFLLVLAAACTFATPSARAQGPTPEAKKYDPQKAFAETDTNEDGVIDREEFHERIVEVFYRADTNKDGFLSPDEYKELVFNDKFTEADTNHDGKVSLREFLRLRFVEFDQVDTDHDGVLSLDEVIRAYQAKGK